VFIIGQILPEIEPNSLLFYATQQLKLRATFVKIACWVSSSRGNRMSLAAPAMNENGRVTDDRRRNERDGLRLSSFVCRLFTQRSPCGAAATNK
jgi:hypothetical protein